MTSEDKRFVKTKEKSGASDLGSTPDAWLCDLYWRHSTKAYTEHQLYMDRIT